MMIDLEELKQIIAERLKIETDLVSDKLEFGSVSEWDSLAHMNLMVALEEKYGIEINGELIQKMISFKAIVSILEKQPKIKLGTRRE